MAEPLNTSTGHVPKGEHKGAFPPFQSQTFASQLVWLVIAFVLLYVLMLKVALPRVAEIIENRQKRIADDIADAGKLKTNRSQKKWQILHLPLNSKKHRQNLWLSG